MSTSPPLHGQPSPIPATSNKPIRRFVVEPVETNSKSSRAKPKRQARERSESPPRTIRRFKPELAEPSTRSSRRNPFDAESSPRQTLGLEDINAPPSSKAAGSANQAKPRRFAPQLIETTKRSRKSGDLKPAHLLTDKTDRSPGDSSYLPRHLRAARPPELSTAPENASIPTSISSPQVSESRFSSAALSRKVPRRTSFRVPELQPIESSESSNESKCPSLSASPSAHSDHGEVPKHKKQARESCDDRFSGYFLALAAKAAQIQLREQALAGFPNEREQEHVDHFAIDQDSDDPSEAEGLGLLSRNSIAETSAARRESAAGWDLTEMRKHQEKLEQQRKLQKDGERPPDTNINTALDAAKDRQNVEERPTGFVPPQNLPKMDGEDEKRMRKAASPPMLGADIIFPKSVSPQATQLAVDQYPRHHTTHSEDKSCDNSGLWTPGTPGSGPGSRRPSAIGLWHGVCTNQDSIQPFTKVLQTGLMTPNIERDDPFISLVAPPWPSGSNPLATRRELPPTPSRSLERTEAVLDDPAYLARCLEEQLDIEFHDSFVTQVYNYLSIGYPSLARKFDFELSKISKIPIEELRKDDGRKNTKGYVGAPEGADARDPEPCVRWRALQLYVREWGRQQPLMKPSRGQDWGERGRRGSWAI